MVALFKAKHREKLHNLITLMLPILGTQLAHMGMGFFDASMSGQAGNVDLAGAAIGSNAWAPVNTGLGGVLLAATPLIANALGADERSKISTILQQGLLLAVAFSLLVLVAGVIGLPLFFGQMGLTPEVYSIALWYCAGVGLGVLPLFLTVPLRSLIDTLGHTDLTMKLYLTALPINALLNYVLIFGKLGLPRLGGVGAGVATGLTYWLMLGMFLFTVKRVAKFRQYLPKSLTVDYRQLREYLRIGIPLGFSIFLEVAVFCVVAFFMAKFGTDTIAAFQAAMNFAALVYMIPLSFSMALTIVIGVEYGAKRFDEAKLYSRLGLQLSVAVAVFYMSLEFFGRGFISQIYSSDANVQQLMQQFIIFALVWQCGDTIAAPIQGILRGYKDVDATFWASVLAYWAICLPVGLLLDYKFGFGPFAYWESLALGVICSAAFLVARLSWLNRKLSGKGKSSCNA